MSLVPPKLVETLQQFSNLSVEELEQLEQCMEMKSLKKGDFFLQQGQVCHHLGFLDTGIMRVFHVANDKEYTSYFNFGGRNPFVSSFSSFITRKPSTESIHALEDCELAVISYTDLEKLYAGSFAFQKLGRMISEFNYTLAVKRIYSLQHFTAQERYNELLNIYPNLINSVPHHYVASYLGITPESLSRIRAGK
ncbi:MAG: Crp/Fnr family transcriptional regulator [Bacteroidota bacterium]|nr:Crp/Fnr family transcriptional regulator [Bacteroidota bacterium]